MKLSTLVFSSLFALSSWKLQAAKPEQIEFFETRIRPVLAQDCYECHSTSGKKKGGLLLDSRAGWQKGGENGQAIIPGNADKSLLIKAIRHEDQDLAMPKAGAKLDDKVIADFVQWINDGAVDPRDKPPAKDELARDTDWNAILNRRKQWWSFQPVNPPVKAIPKGTNPVDVFVDEKLRESGLNASPIAGPAILLRRLSYVLDGMPPTPEEIATFEKAAQVDLPAAISTTVDRLLNSPRYGETWARHWMDWVRFAESYGSEGDPPIPYAWRYRDYLIRAFNNDVPYNQLVREAIAGDLLPQPRINKVLGINESALGIGQLRMVLHGFSPTDTLDEMVTFTDNQIDTVGKAFLGLTVSCARCHNHKFDAISQTDFYSWFGIFSSTHPAVVDVNLPDNGAEIRAELKRLKSQIRTVVGKAWLDEAAKLQSTPEPVAAAAPPSIKSWNLSKDQWFADGNSVKQGASTAGDFSVALEGENDIASIHPAGVFTDLVSTKDRGVLISPTFRCEGGTLWIHGAGAGGARARYIVQNYPRTGTIHKAKEYKDKSDGILGWHKLDLEYWKGDDIFIQCTTVADMPAENRNDERSWFGITEAFITKSTETPAPDRIGGDPKKAVEAWLNGTCTDSQAKLLDSLLHGGKLPAHIVAADALLAKYRELEAKLPSPVRAPGVLEADAHDAPLFTRGNHKQPGELVKRCFLSSIDPRPFNPSNSGRLQLAESIVAPSDPLVSRVIVNRIWHHVFGRGIVGTPDNLGRLGELPTHPELLDYLAHRFNQDGTSIKAMIKLLVTSQAFLRDSHAPAAALEKDPENKLLSHFGVRRLEAESIRDTILSLTNELDSSLYGESVSGNDKRRSVYVKVIRNNLDDFLNVFDAPVPTGTRGRRDATNVPAQSLTLLNSPRIKDWATRWAKNTAGNDDERIRQMFGQSLCRAPSPNELSSCRAFLQESAEAGKNERSELARIEAQQTKVRHQMEAITRPVREALLAAKTKSEPAAFTGHIPTPYAEWDFEDGAQDLCGHLPLTLEGAAHIEKGALVLEGTGAYARSKPLTKTLTTKTLEAWVTLDSLDQRGGGVVTVQDLHGGVFDSIVFAEKESQQWMAGSDFSRRTQSFKGPEENEAESRAVHVALVYKADGTILGYRDGKLYGAEYHSAGPVTFEANASEVLIGCRHGSGGGNKLLHGKVLRARLYDRDLSAEEIAASRHAEQAGLAERDVMAALTEAQRAELAALQTELTSLSESSRSLSEQLQKIGGPEQAWASLALSLINLKEFIYLK